MMNFIIRNILVIFVISMGLNACGTGRASCFNEEMSKAELMWGDLNSLSRMYSGYKLESTGKLFSYNRDSLGKVIQKEIAALNDKETCKILGLFYWSMKTVQVCNEPGNNLKFMIFNNEAANTNWYVVWNDKFKSGSNKNLKQTLDSIEIIINTIGTKQQD